MGSKSTANLPPLERPRFHVWMAPDDAEDSEDTETLTYVGLVTVTNDDQLTAEKQARAQGYGDIRETPFTLTSFWIWAAMVRKGTTAHRFPEFTKRMEYRPDREEAEPEPDPTTTAQGVSTP